MEIIGIICEFNPLHNGHVYYIDKIKELYPDSLIVCVLNGYFMERGEISIMSKEDKTNCSLNHNVDIIVELPFVYGTQSADIFAYNSVKLLNEMRVDRIIFGSESNNIQLLEKVAKIQLEDPSYLDRVKEYLSEGVNYPTAMAKALDIKEDISNPNDLLGISYIKAIKQINERIKYGSIKRTNDYHDVEIDSNIVSGSNIRVRLSNDEEVDKYVPLDVKDKIIKINEDKLFTLLKFKILTDKDLSIYLDVDEGIEYRIVRNINDARTLDELIESIKTKRYTYNKINRMLIHILIGLTKEDNDNNELDYLKILGFNTKGQEYLNKIKKSMTLGMDKDSIIYKYELTTSNIYKQITGVDSYSFDSSNKPILKD